MSESEAIRKANRDYDDAIVELSHIRTLDELYKQDKTGERMPVDDLMKQVLERLERTGRARMIAYGYIKDEQ